MCVLGATTNTLAGKELGLSLLLRVPRVFNWKSGVPIVSFNLSYISLKNKMNVRRWSMRRDGGWMWSMDILLLILKFGLTQVLWMAPHVIWAFSDVIPKTSSWRKTWAHQGVSTKLKTKYINMHSLLKAQSMFKAIQFSDYSLLLVNIFLIFIYKGILYYVFTDISMSNWLP